MNSMKTPITHTTPSGAKHVYLSDADYKTLKNLADNAENRRIRDVLRYVLGGNEITKLFDDLAKNQQPLGEDFQKTINENLSDLYITDDTEES